MNKSHIRNDAENINEILRNRSELTPLKRYYWGEVTLKMENGEIKQIIKKESGKVK